MGRERTLLERIAERGGRASSRYEASAGEDLEVLMESVRNNLVRLLNARHGMSEAQPEYGLPALNDLTVGAGEYVRRTQEAIRRSIEKFEPRLRRVQVSLREDRSTAQTLVFRVDAVLVSQKGEHRVWYETAVKASGQLEVAG
jgi:type VI secretion system protein